jgi:hypothetical protein
MTRKSKLNFLESVRSDFPQHITQELWIKFGVADNELVAQTLVLNESSPGSF